VSDEPRALCGAYIACVGKANPGALNEILAAYAEDGTCWKTQTSTFCRDACIAGISQLHAGIDAPECNICLTNKDCPHGTGAFVTAEYTAASTV
jgi:hypothetical protein